MKVKILGIKIDSLNKRDIVRLVEEKIKNREKFFIITPNPEFLVAASRNRKFKKILESADLAIPDGVGLIHASVILGTQPKIKERVSGADVVEELLRIGALENWKIGIVGARRGDKRDIDMVIEELRKKFQVPSTKYQIQAYELDEKFTKTKFDLIFACHGMIKQEEWISKNMNEIDCPVFMGIGGSLDFLTGFTKRAPGIVRKLGLEWLWRLIRNPRRHLGRVFNAVIVFYLLVLRDKVTSRGN